MGEPIVNIANKASAVIIDRRITNIICYNKIMIYLKL